MKIKKIKTFVVGNPPPHFGGRYWVILKIITDNKLVGIGESYSIPFHPKVVVKMIEDVFQRLVVNKNPYNKSLFSILIFFLLKKIFFNKNE